MRNQMRRDGGFTIGELLWVIIILGGCLGWVLNIIKLVAVISDPLTGMTVLRGVGIVVAPLGAILGYVG